MSVMDFKATVEIVEDDPAGCDTLALRRRRLTMAVCFIAILAGLLLNGDVEVIGTAPHRAGRRRSPVHSVHSPAQDTESQTLMGT